MVFGLIFILFSFSACQNHKNTDKTIENAQSINFDYLGRTINITNTIDLKNIDSFVSNMKKVDKRNDQIGWIEGKINFEDGSNLVFLANENQVCIGEKCYEGLQQGIAIQNILNQYIYDRRY